MNEKSDASKPKEKRIEEKERLDAEVERAQAVVKVKESHKQIEDIERMRKRSTILSLCKRIDNLSEPVARLANKLAGYVDVPIVFPDSPWAEEILYYEKAYDSICYDLQKNLEINDENFARLFPRIKMKLGKRSVVVTTLLNIVEQLMDMKIYCERILM